MKAYRSLLINNIPHSVVEKKIYGAPASYWTLIKGGMSYNCQILSTHATRDEAINQLQYLWDKR